MRDEDSCLATIEPRFDVLNFTRNEALEEFIMIDMSIETNYAPDATEWINGGT